VVATVYRVEPEEGVILVQLALNDLGKPYLKKLIEGNGAILAQPAGFDPADEKWIAFLRSNGC
jgi:hypothetical protein